MWRYFDLMLTNEPFDWHPLRSGHNAIEIIDISLSIFSLWGQPNEQRLKEKWSISFETVCDHIGFESNLKMVWVCGVHHSRVVFARYNLHHSINPMGEWNCENGRVKTFAENGKTTEINDTYQNKPTFGLKQKKTSKDEWNCASETSTNTSKNKID